MEGLTDARILVVDDEPANVRLLQRLLELAGYTNVRATTDAREVRALYEAFQPDLILLDLTMPQLDGVAVMGQLPIPEGEYMPVLVLTADATPEAKQRALAAGAKDFLTSKTTVGRSPSTVSPAEARRSSSSFPCRSERTSPPRSH